MGDEPDPGAEVGERPEGAGVAGLSGAGQRNGARARRRRRQANRPGQRRWSHEVSVTEWQEAVLLARAESAGVTVARWLVEAGTAREPGVTGEERRAWLAELLALQRVVAGIANNVNQLAAASNATGQLERERLVAVADRCDRVLARAESAVETVAGW